MSSTLFDYHPEIANFSWLSSGGEEQRRFVSDLRTYLNTVFVKDTGPSEKRVKKSKLLTKELLQKFMVDNELEFNFWRKPEEMKSVWEDNNEGPISGATSMRSWRLFRLALRLSRLHLKRQRMRCSMRGPSASQRGSRLP